MKKYRVEFVFVILLVLTGCLFFIIGIHARQNTIEQRALRIKEKDCYNWQDIEIIIFSEIQE